MQKKAFLLGSILFVSSLFFPLASFAQTNQEAPVILPKAEVVNHDYLAAGQTVDIEGTVNGDVYAAGGSVFINGVVNGDVLAAGGQVIIEGSAHNVRVAGGQVSINGTVLGNVSAVGGTVTVGNAAKIAGGLVGAGGQMLLLGPIGKTVYASASQIRLQNTVGGQVSVVGREISVGPSAIINGPLWYMSQNNLNLEKGASIKGKVSHAYPPQEEKTQPTVAPFAFLVGAKVISSIYSLVLGVIVGLILIFLVPMYTQKTLLLIQTRPWLSLGIGFLTWVVTPILLVLLLLTIIGIPFAILALIGVVVFTYIGKVYASMYVGEWILGLTSVKAHVVWGLVVGLVVVEIISWIPIIGGLFSLILTAIGLGSVMILEKRLYMEARVKKII